MIGKKSEGQTILGLYFLKSNLPIMKLNQLTALPPDKECETVATGFQQLDHLTGGLRTGQLCTIAAQPGMGKTAFAVSLLRNIGVAQKVPTAYFSLESSEWEIKERLKASITGRLECVPCKVITPPVDVIDAMEKIGFHMKKVRVWNRKPCEKRRSCFHRNSLVWQFFTTIWSKRCS